jgi:hypothetical protein
MVPAGQMVMPCEEAAPVSAPCVPVGTPGIEVEGAPIPVPGMVLGVPTRGDVPVGPFVVCGKDATGAASAAARNSHFIGNSPPTTWVNIPAVERRRRRAGGTL